MNIVKLLIFLLPFNLYASMDHQKQHSVNNDIICIEDLRFIGHLGFFTWSMKSVLDKLAGSEFLNEKEWKVIEQNPQLYIKLKSAADFAMKNSESLCKEDSTLLKDGVYGYADEVDAVRHFSMSAYLALTTNEKTARLFMTAHENSKYKKDNMMDYYNNDLGYKLAKKYRQRVEEIPFGRKKSFIKQLIKHEAQRILNSDENNDFLVSSSSPNTCSKNKYPNF